MLNELLRICSSIEMLRDLHQRGFLVIDEPSFGKIVDLHETIIVSFFDHLIDLDSDFASEVRSDFDKQYPFTEYSLNEIRHNFNVLAKPFMFNDEHVLTVRFYDNIPQSSTCAKVYTRKEAYRVIGDCTFLLPSEQDKLPEVASYYVLVLFQHLTNEDIRRICPDSEHGFFSTGNLPM